jgi:hypothetical protein
MYHIQHGKRGDTGTLVPSNDLLGQLGMEGLSINKLDSRTSMPFRCFIIQVTMLYNSDKAEM